MAEGTFETKGREASEPVHIEGVWGSHIAPKGGQSAVGSDPNAQVRVVAEPSAEFRATAELPKTLMGGTRSMRQAGAAYLPRHPSEHPTAWAVRLRQTFLYNGFERAVQMLVGKVFQDGIALDPDTPQLIRDWSEDIDMEGRDLATFAEDWFEEVLQTGMCHALADFPRAEGDGTFLTDLTLRPYLTLIPGESVIGFRTERSSSGLRLTQLRVLEKGLKPSPQNPWVDVEVERVRVYYAGDPTQEDASRTEPNPKRYARFEVWEQDARTKRWAKTRIAGSLRPHVDIPIATAYAARESFMHARPPLDDLAWKNVEHWQSSSEQRNVLHVARVPILFAKALTEQERQSKKVIGSLVGWFATKAEAEMKWVEHSGSAANIGFKDLDELKQEMAVMALEPMLQRPTTRETLGGRILDESVANSRLGAWVRNFEDSLDKALSLLGAWKDIEYTGHINIKADFGITTPEAKDLKELITLRLERELSQQTLYDELVRRGVLPEDFDYEEELRRLAGEGEGVSADLAAEEMAAEGEEEEEEGAETEAEEGAEEEEMA